MKKVILLLLLTEVTFGLFAQKDSSDNYVKQFLTIPSFKTNIVPDSAVYTNGKLIKNTPFILMFFSPDCEHCQQETKELLAFKKELKGIQILMLSIASYPEIKEFYETFGLSSMPGIKVGQDENFRLGTIYRVRIYPSLFVYDKEGNLTKAFVGNISIPAILDAIK